MAEENSSSRGILFLVDSSEASALTEYKKILSSSIPKILENKNNNVAIARIDKTYYNHTSFLNQSKQIELLSEIKKYLLAVIAYT